MSGWMSVKERFDYLTACLMYKCLCFNHTNMNYLLPVFEYKIHIVIILDLGQQMDLLNLYLGLNTINVACHSLEQIYGINYQ